MRHIRYYIQILTDVFKKRLKTLQIEFGFMNTFFHDEKTYSEEITLINVLIVSLINVLIKQSINILFSL